MAFIQYSYFFRMRWDDGQKIRAGDWPHIKRVKDELADASRSGRTDAAFLEWVEKQRQWVDKEPARFLREMAERNRPMFRELFSLMIGVVAPVFFSIVLDFAWLMARPRDLLYFRHASTVLMLVALMMFGLGFVHLVRKLRV